MKHLSKLAIIFSVLIFSLNSCKKNDSAANAISQSTAPLELKVKTYLGKQVSSTTATRALKIKDLENSIDYKSLAIKDLHKNSKVIMGSVMSKANSKTDGNVTKKVIFYLVGDEITDGKIITFSSKDPLPDKLEDVISLRRNAYTGSMTLSTIYNKYLIQFDLKDGTVTDTKVMQSKLPKSAGGKNNEQSRVNCLQIDWYLITTYHLPDGSTYTTEEYVGSTCEGCSPDNPDMQSRECQGSGEPSGGGAGDQQSCTLDQGMATTYPYNIFYQSGDGTTRTKTYVWRFYGTIGNIWSFKSHETGVHVLENNEWHWQSLTHNSISKEGLVIGGNITCTLNSATPTIGIYWAGMALNVNLVFSVICQGAPLTWSNSSSAVKYFNVND